MIRWLWSRMMKWGWDFNRNLREEDDDFPRLRHRPARRRDEIVALGELEGGIDLTDPISFRVQAVAGGTLVETRWYDPKTDNHDRKLHIVTSDENLADAIGKIVTMELLKR